MWGDPEFPENLITNQTYSQTCLLLDIHVSGTIQGKGIWDPHTVKGFQNILQTCLFTYFSDIHVSGTVRREGIWEQHIVKEFQNILYSDPDLGFIDIGANIGLHSLVALTMGYTVLAVEPLEVQ